jgi:dienelactone hydrolase
MRRFVLTMFVCFSVAGFVFGQQTFRVTSPSVIAYLEYLPADYHSNSDKYPVVIFLHGIGERGTNTTDTTLLKQSIGTVTRNGPPLHVKNGTQFPFILISPQLKSNYGDWPSAYVMEVIEHCKTYLRIDEKRIYLTGLSLGGGGTWWTAQDFPKTFAAIAPVCGSRNSVTKACYIAAENIPVWAFHGTEDGVVAMTKSLNMVNAINACLPIPNPLAKLTLYPGIGHDSWTNAYQPNHSVHNPNVYEWMLSYTNTRNTGNSLPVANAGADITVNTSSVTLSGSASDEDGSIASYSWTKVSGAAIAMTNSAAPALELTGLPVGEYIFRLKVTDNSGNTDSDYVRIKVQSNTAPVVNAGADVDITLPVNTTSLAAIASDTDGTIANYSWEKISGGTATLSVSGQTLTVSDLSDGSYVFKVTVTDNSGATTSDEVTVVVKAPELDAARPALVVSAGTDKIVKLPTTSATLLSTVSGSDGSPLTYRWSQLSGAACTMLYTTTSKMLVKYLASGVYSFRITVTDSYGSSVSDDIVVTVDAPPVVNAGADITVALPTNQLTLTGSATDADGTIVKYRWSKYSGPNVTVSGSSTPTVTLNGLVAGTYVFKLTVTDNIGVTGIDYVTVIVQAGTSL